MQGESTNWDDNIERVLITERLATLNELKCIYSVEDVYMMYNLWVKNEILKFKSSIKK